MLTHFTLPKEHDGDPLTKRLWLQSRRHGDEVIPAGQARTVTLANLRIAFDAVVLLAPRAWNLLRSPEYAEGVRLLLEYLLIMTVYAVLPSWNMWTTTQLMDLAERSLTGGAVPVSLAAWSAFMVVLTRVLTHLARKHETRLERRLSDFYRWKLERAFLALKLSEPPAGSEDADRVAMLYEAGVHAGHESAFDADGSLRWMVGEVRYRVRSMGQLLMRALAIVSELSVAWVALGGSGVPPAALLVVFLPWLARAAAGLVDRPALHASARSRRSARQRRLETLRNTLSAVFRSHTDEVHMLDMRDFLLDKWEQCTHELNEIHRAEPQSAGTTLIDNALSTLSWFLITTKLVTIDASLGSLIVIHHVMEDLNWRLATIIDNGRDALNHVFFVLPYVAIADEEKCRKTLIDYETTRARVASPTAKARMLQKIAEGADGGEPGQDGPAETRAELGAADDILEMKLDAKPAAEPDTSPEPTRVQSSTDATPALSAAVSERLNETNEMDGTCTPAESDGTDDPRATVVPSDKRVSVLSDDERDVIRVDSGVGSLASEDDVHRGMAISLSEVSVIYPDGSVAVRGVNLEIAAGETLAIVGHNGSGKTTLVKALLGLLRYEGSIRVNGVGLRELEPASVARRVATVFQETTKHGLTLGEEIGIGSLGTPCALPAAVARGGAAPILERVPLDTPLAAYTREHAEKHFRLSRDDLALGDWHRRARTDTYLSGGEWQRVALSRAFMRAHADLIVFDEPTAALDPRAESDLFETLLALGARRECTTVFISHGFGNVRRADRIAFMDKGRIVEYGTHEQLVALGARYFEFYSLQANRFK